MRAGHRAADKLALAVFFDVSDDVFDALELFSFFIRHFDGELFFERHDEFDGVERVCAQVFDELGIRHDLFSIHAELIDNDIFNFFFDGFFGHKIDLLVNVGFLTI
jgi:hypothetical protein